MRLNLGGEVKGKTKSKKIEDHHHLVWKKSKIMESGLQAQIEKLEAKLKQYRRDNEELRDKNMKSEMLIKLRQMTQDRKEQIISDQNNHIEKLMAQIKKLKDENDFNQRQKNQEKKKEISDYKAEIICLKKIVNDKDEELMHI